MHWALSACWLPINIMDIGFMSNLQPISDLPAIYCSKSTIGTFKIPNQHILECEGGGNVMKQEANIQSAVLGKNTGPCIPGGKVLQLCLIDIVCDELS
jgi:hypothetical protein